MNNNLSLLSLEVDTNTNIDNKTSRAESDEPKQDGWMITHPDNPTSKTTQSQLAKVAAVSVRQQVCD